MAFSFELVGIEANSTYFSISFLFVIVVNTLIIQIDGIHSDASYFFVVVPSPHS
jgi:hypothetical protein